jgi:hypothetical protein
LHGPAWGKTPLVASGGSGNVTCPATFGTIFVGSTTIPDPAALFATDEAGLRYQVLFTIPTPTNGIAGSDPANPLVLVGIDTGEQTNLPSGAKLKWGNPPVGAQPEATVVQDFTGGTPAENDLDFASRILADIRHKPASGNSAHFRSWARDASSAIEDACVYACAHHAGSVHVAILQKRSNVAGPLARVPSAGTLTAATAYLTPPGSPVVPKPPHVVVTGFTPRASNLVLSLAMPKGRSSGYKDLVPWPSQAGGTPALIVAVVTPIAITISAPSGLPSGVTQPSIMVWDDALSRFEEMHVFFASPSGGGLYTISLASPTAKTLAVGDYISPMTARAGEIAETIEAYFDALGPGELVDLATDPRGHRVFRFPEPNEELPQRAGSAVTGVLQDALGGSLTSAALESISLAVPALPAEPIDGPDGLVLGRLGVYSF